MFAPQIEPVCRVSPTVVPSFMWRPFLSMIWRQDACCCLSDLIKSLPYGADDWSKAIITEVRNKTNNNYDPLTAARLRSLRLPTHCVCVDRVRRSGALPSNLHNPNHIIIQIWLSLLWPGGEAFIPSSIIITHCINCCSLSLLSCGVNINQDPIALTELSEHHLITGCGLNNDWRVLIFPFYPN